MEVLKLFSDNPIIKADIKISGSKSETNRLLILQALFPNIEILNLSDSDDSKVLQKALNSESNLIDIGHAGTAMRFLTAYFAFHGNGEKILTGSERMQNRPIGILVDALNLLGADISYLEKKRFPPLRIRSKKVSGEKIKVQANISSQYISSLLLIAPKFKNGLEIELKGEILSRPYIEMTLKILENIGVKTSFKNQNIQVFPLKTSLPQKISVEPDWSSASYFYSLAALSEQAEIRLENFRKNSLQGDSKVAELYKNFGVSTDFDESGILLKKEKNAKLPSYFEADFKNFPDLAQTLAATCVGLRIPLKLTGLSTLRIKETDRLEALKNELTKLGAEIEIVEDQLFGKMNGELKSDVSIKTYQDHRMAMAIAPLGLKTKLQIENPEVVSKSYPNFWADLKKCGL